MKEIATLFAVAWFFLVIGILVHLAITLATAARKRFADWRRRHSKSGNRKIQIQQSILPEDLAPMAVRHVKDGKRVNLRSVK